MLCLLLHALACNISLAVLKLSRVLVLSLLLVLTCLLFSMLVHSVYGLAALRCVHKAAQMPQH